MCSKDSRNILEGNRGKSWFGKARVLGLIVFNKMDILDEVQCWCAFEGDVLYEFKSRKDIELWLETKLHLEVDKDIEVMFSGDKEFI